jgi:hypothetical protein
MPFSQQLLDWRDVLAGTVAVLTRSSARETSRRLSPAEQAEFTTYYHAMTLSQEQTYLAKGTATERTAYLREIGLSQRFAALSPVDRATVRRQRPYPGMSADALRFLWGEPYDIVRQTAWDERWYYLDVSCGWDALPTHASHGTQVEVYLVEGHVITWRKPWSDSLHTWSRADADAGGHTVWSVR